MDNTTTSAIVGIAVVALIVYMYMTYTSQSVIPNMGSVRHTVGSKIGFGCGCDKCVQTATGATVEQRSVAENQENFTGCGAGIVSNSLSCDATDFAYATNDFGAPGATFTDYITSNAVDPDVIKNHDAFTQDRKTGNPNAQNRVGATFSADGGPAGNQFNYMPFTGLRRPTALPTSCGNQASVPDIDIDAFERYSR